jgi:hypothetical protein
MARSALLRSLEGVRDALSASVSGYLRGFVSGALLAASRAPPFLQPDLDLSLFCNILPYQMLRNTLPLHLMLVL